MNEKLLYDLPVKEAIGAKVSFFNVATGKWRLGKVIGIFCSMVWIVGNKNVLSKVQRGFVKLQQ